LMQRTFAPDYFMSLRMEVRLGQELELQDLLDTLTKLGYHAEYQVNDPGDMAMRGGIVDFFPLDRGEPVRVEFSGNEIESIRTFDPITQQSREKREHLVVTPAGELGLLKQATDQTAPLVDLLPRNTLLVLDEPDKLAAAAENYARQIPEGDKFFAEWASHLGVGADHRPTDRGARHRSAGGVHQPAPCLARCVRPLDTRSPEPEIAEQMRRSFFERCSAGQRRAIPFRSFAATIGEKQRFEELWREHDENVVRRSPDRAALDRRSPEIGAVRRPAPNNTGVIHCRLSAGFLWTDAKLAVVTDSEIFGRYKLVRPAASFHQLAQATDWTELQEGDFVVHVQHGIGKYLGLKSLDFNGTKQESSPSSMRRSAALRPYRPGASRLEIFWRGQTTAAVAPTRRRALAKAKAHCRARHHGSRRQPARDPGRASTLEAMPSRPTPPGKTSSRPRSSTTKARPTYAISEVKNDMESSRPMDRLICGDVGYGKNRGRHPRRVQSGDGRVSSRDPLPDHDSSPNSIGNTFRERMSGYPITIEMLSRFRSPGEQKKVAKLLREGGVGTSSSARTAC